MDLNSQPTCLRADILPQGQTSVVKLLPGNKTSSRLSCRKFQGSEIMLILLMFRTWSLVWLGLWRQMCLCTKSSDLFCTFVPKLLEENLAVSASSGLRYISLNLKLRKTGRTNISPDKDIINSGIDVYVIAVTTSVLPRPLYYRHSQVLTEAL